MIQGLVWFLIGIAFGMSILIIIVQRDMPFLNKWNKRVQPVIMPTLIIGGALYLVFRNAPLFFDPKPEATFTGLEQEFFKIPANDAVLMLGGYVTLVSAFSFVLRIPFSNWQQIKIFGLFEATRIKEEAQEEIKTNRELEFNRLVRLEVFSSHEKGYQTILQNMNQKGEVIADNILGLLMESLTATYYDGGLKLLVDGGYIDLLELYPSDTPERVKDIWMGVPRDNYRKAYRLSTGWESYVLFSTSIGRKTYVIWLRSGEYTFSEIDEVFLLSIRNAIEHYIALAYVDAKVI